MEKRYPIPPFTAETAFEKIQLAKDTTNSQDMGQVVNVYTTDSEWRNHLEFIKGSGQNTTFPTGKWKKESECKLKKEYWAYTENRIAVRFEYEYQDEQGKWYRSYGNENWEFDADGFMVRRSVTINDLEIEKKDVKFMNQ